jgi:hypothetical protein
MSAITIASSAAARIGRLIRLLGSDRSGEVVAAATAINRTLSAVGLDLHYLADVTERALVTAKPEPILEHHEPVATMIGFCWIHLGQLSAKEQDFIINLEKLVRRLGERFDPSDRQLAWLISIYDRIRSRQ